MEKGTEELKRLQEELQVLEKIQFSPPPSVSEVRNKKEDGISKMEALSQEIRNDVPKLLNRLKGIMGEKKEKEFNEMSEYERKIALKDMENAIKILSEEYDKCAIIEKEEE
jgi:hypothetical protein